MSALKIRVAVLSDAAELAPLLRELDKLEIVLSEGHTDLVAGLETAMGLSDLYCLTLTEDDAVIAIGGLAKTPFGAMPWMLGSDRTVVHAKYILKEARTHTARWLAEHGHLYNWTLASNTTHLRWLERLGFTLGPVIQAGPLKSSFRSFYKKNVHPRSSSDARHLGGIDGPASTQPAAAG